MRVINVYPYGAGITWNDNYAGPTWTGGANIDRCLDAGESFDTKDPSVIDDPRISKYDKVLVHGVTADIVGGTLSW